MQRGRRSIRAEGKEGAGAKEGGGSRPGRRRAGTGRIGGRGKRGKERQGEGKGGEGKGGRSRQCGGVEHGLTSINFYGVHSSHCPSPAPNQDQEPVERAGASAQTSGQGEARPGATGREERGRGEGSC